MTLEKRKFAYGISTTYNSCSFRPVVNVPLAKVKQRRQKESSVPPGYFYFILYFSPTIFACARVNDVICITRVMHTQRRARWSALLVSFRSIPVLGFLSGPSRLCAARSGVDNWLLMFPLFPTYHKCLGLSSTPSATTTCSRRNSIKQTVEKSFILFILRQMT